MSIDRVINTSGRSLYLDVLGITVPPNVEARLLPGPPKGWKRPAMTVQTKLAVVLRQEGRCKATGVKFGDVKDIRFDHRPAIYERAYDGVANDTVPACNDPKFIEAVTAASHDDRTFGTGGTTLGGDLGRAARGRSAGEAELRHRAAMAEKAGDRRGAKKLLAGVRPARRRTKAKITNRKNAWPPRGARKLKSRA